MAAAYAALVSLTNILHQILHPPPSHHFIIPKEQIESLSEKVYCLIEFLENYSSICCSKEYENLVRWIADAAYDVEDLIETEVVRQIRAKSGDKSCQLLCHGIQKAMVKLHSLEKKSVKIKERKGFKNLQHETSSSRPFTNNKNVMVGFDEHLIQIMSAIASDESNRQIIPIVGMGGIGKTTLATNVYNNPLIIEHFHVRAWITISQDYTVGELLLKLLHQISNSNGQMSDDQIGLLLHKELYYRKYLVVMDDIWSIQAWDKIKMFFPNNYNGSRILVTTRLSNLVADFGSCRPYKMGLLDEKQSWNLLREKVLSNERCPRELEEIGKRISERCGGLPLALVVIGGILAKSKRTREHWEYVEENVISC